MGLVPITFTTITISSGAGSTTTIGNSAGTTTFNGGVVMAYSNPTSSTISMNDVDVLIQSNGAATAATGALPTTATDGQLRIVSTDDPNGLNVLHASATAVLSLTGTTAAGRFVWTGGTTSSWRVGF